MPSVFDGKPKPRKDRTLPKQYQGNSMHNLSADYAGSGGPRVGSDKKKGTVKVSKPSRVQSGIKLKKKKR